MSKLQLNQKKLSFSVSAYGAFLMLALFKLFVVSGEEILARYAPHDELWYILAASRWVWFSPNYDLMTLIHMPIYPIFIALVHLTGVPLRIGIELTFILSGFYFAYALRKIKVSQIICLATFGLIIFQPLSFDLFDRTLAETFYAPLLLASLASIILMWISTGRKKIYFSIITGFLLALLWFTREESLLITGLLGIIFLLVVLVTFRDTRNWKKVFDQLKTALFIPAVIIIAFTVIIDTANYFKYGLFAATELDGSGYKDAYTALLNIKSGNPVRFVPVTTETRQMAYSVSPSFRELQPYLEDRSNFAFFWSKKTMGIDNEMAAGWFYWMLREAVNSAGYKTAPAENAFYERVANEINRAISENKIPSRFAPFSFLDPGTFSYWYYFPNSLKNVSALFIDTRKPTEADLTDNIFSGKDKILIDSMTSRRIHGIDAGPVTLNGWAYSSEGNITKVSLLNESGEIIAETKVSASRPDVQAAFKNKVNNIPEDTGFSLKINQPEGSLANANLVFKSDNKQSFQAPYSQLKILKPAQIGSDSSGQSLDFSIDQKITPDVSRALALKNHVQNFIWSVYGNIILCLTYLGMLAILIMFFLWKLLDYRKPIYSIILILLSVVVARVLLFTVLDVDSWSAAQQPRYLFPVMPVYSSFLLILIYQAYRLIKGKIASSK